MALSDKEQNILAELERDLASDPQFVSSMTHSNRLHLGSGKRIIAGTLGFVASITLLLVGITSHLVILGVLGFAGMIAGAFWAFSGNPKNAPANLHVVGGSPRTKTKSAFMKNLEDKWEERRNSENR